MLAWGKGGRMGNDTHSLILEKVERQVDVQLEAIERLDTKLSVVLGFCGVIISLVLQAEKLPMGFRGGLVILSLTMLVALWAYGACNVHRDPEPHFLVEHYWDEEQTVVNRALVGGLLGSYARNASTIESKVSALKWTLGGTAIGVMLLVASAFAMTGA